MLWDIRNPQYEGTKWGNNCPAYSRIFLHQAEKEMPAIRIADPFGNGGTGRHESGRNHGTGAWPMERKERLMKDKTLTVILALALICFAGLSIFLFWNLRKSREQVTVLSENIISTDEELDGLQEQLEGLQEQAADLSRELEESKAKVKDLEDTIGEGNAQIAEMQSTIEENAATIAALEEQLEEAQRHPQTNSNGNSNPSSNSSTPINPMPQGTDPAGRNGSAIGTGDGGPYAGMVGTFE